MLKGSRNSSLRWISACSSRSRVE